MHIFIKLTARVQLYDINNSKCIPLDHHLQFKSKQELVQPFNCSKPADINQSESGNPLTPY